MHVGERLFQDLCTCHKCRLGRARLKFAQHRFGNLKTCAVTCLHVDCGQKALPGRGVSSTSLTFRCTSPCVATPRLHGARTYRSTGWYPTNGKKDNHPHQARMERYAVQVGKCCTDSRTWSHCRRKSRERCKCNIGRPIADSFGRPRARYSILTSPIHGKTARRRFWIIRQCW